MSTSSGGSLRRGLAASSIIAVAATSGGTAAFAVTPGSPPSGTYSARLVPFDSSVTGTAALTFTGKRWIAAVQLEGLTTGDTYDYEVSIAGSYVDGQAHSFHAVPLCSFTATASQGSCADVGARLGAPALTPQTVAFLYSPQAHTSVTDGEFSYLAALSPYDGMSYGGSATVTYDGHGTWSGRVSVSGLSSGTTYTWAADIAEAYSHGQPVSFHRIVLCDFVATGGRTSGCTASRVSIEGRSDIPDDSATDVASALTSVADGVLH